MQGVANLQLYPSVYFDSARHLFISQNKTGGRGLMGESEWLQFRNRLPIILHSKEKKNEWRKIIIWSIYFFPHEIKSKCVDVVFLCTITKWNYLQFKDWFFKSFLCKIKIKFHKVFHNSSSIIIYILLITLIKIPNIKIGSMKAKEKFRFVETFSPEKTLFWRVYFTFP